MTNMMTSVEEEPIWKTTPTGRTTFIVPLVLAASAVESTSFVMTAGLAETAAGSIAMGLGGYLAARSDAEHDASERRRVGAEVVDSGNGCPMRITSLRPASVRSRSLFRANSGEGERVEQAQRLFGVERVRYLQDDA
jgi:hypothetical protein